MRLTFTILAFVSLAGPGFGQCATQQATFMSCTFNNGAKSVSVCVEGSQVIYSYGPTGAAPELELSTPVVMADYVPWPGVSSFFEAVTFRNGNISYVVAAGESRLYPEDDDGEIGFSVWGDITVIENEGVAGAERELAALICDEGSTYVTYGGSLADAKAAAGQCWVQAEQRWDTCS